MTHLSTILKNISGCKLLVIGDVMLDHYIWGDVHRISPEAPVPVVHAERDTYTAGGAANVALNLAHLGATTTLMGYCGNDEAGSKLQTLLHTNHIQFINPVVQSQTPTIVKTRVIVRSQQLCRIDREAALQDYIIENAPEFDSHLQQALAEADAVIISDYAKGVITQPLFDKVLAYASSNLKVLVTVDPKPSRQLHIKGAGLLTPNKTEALQLARLPEIHTEAAYPLQEVSRRIFKFYEPEQLVITLGADGMAVCGKDQTIRHLPTQAKEVYDVSGAGDTVIATLTAALVVGAGIFQAAQLANMAAACVVSHVGTVPISLYELQGKIIEVNQPDS
jgi:D-glycero-beta-D-manno-heptose-7-phosphate kinase